MTQKCENVLLGEPFIHSSKKQCCLYIGQQDVNKTTNMDLADLPLGIVRKILGYLSFGNISKLRLVSKYFDHICSDLLNTEFERLKATVLQRHNYLKTQMPRRESSRRKHPLFRENNIVALVHVRLTLLNLTLGKYVEKNHGCFFAGEILDEVNRIISDFRKNDFNPSYNITEEIFDLSTMAVEYFKDHIELVLPQELSISEFSEKSMHSTTKRNSCVLKVADELPKQKTPKKIVDLSLKELEKSLRKNSRIVYLNGKDINSIKLSLKSLKKEISTLENKICLVKQQLKECKGIPEQDKANKEIPMPKDNMNELFKKLIRCKEGMDSCESQLFETQQSELKIVSKDNITGVDDEACAEGSGTKSCLENYQNEKICYESKSNVLSINLSSALAKNKKEKIKLISAPCLVSTRSSLKRKCKTIPSKVLSKKKKQT